MGMKAAWMAVALLWAPRTIAAEKPERLNIGRAATAEEIARWDIAVRPDGRGLPAGRGTAAQGTTVYFTKCAACHGPEGEGLPNLGSRLIGPPREKFDFALSAQTESQKTIGNYWPFATTLFDYTRRAMPLNAPGSLTADEIYASVAYLLAKNGVIAESAVMDAQSLPKVRMPARERFVPDDRLDSNRVK
jgi:cytochrome c